MTQAVTLTLEMAGFWIQKLLCFSVVLQSIEMLILSSSLTETGVWRWTLVKADFQIFPKWVRSISELVMPSMQFQILNLLRIIVAIALFFEFSPQIRVFSVFFLLLSQMLVAWRWRGSFNGGSDFMSLLSLIVLVIFVFFHGIEKVQMGALLYLGLQTVATYFIAGLIKIKHRNWRSGLALIGFANMSIYNGFWKKRILNQQVSFRNTTSFLTFSKVLSWGLFVFELSFPLCLLGPQWCLVYLSLAMLFHGLNWWIFGLNRFFWAWLAAYPAIFYCSLWIQNHS